MQRCLDFTFWMELVKIQNEVPNSIGIELSGTNTACLKWIETNLIEWFECRDMAIVL
jgi:hypothetical protein